jgi:enamine deaminase RidA (YjgF/YER057c/UK114 family)
VKTAGLDPPNGYARVVEATRGKTVYMLGQVPLDVKGDVVGPGDFRAQITQVFENLKTALGAVGAGFGDVAETTYYVLDMSNSFILREVCAQYLDAAPRASTLVEVKRMANDAFLVEVELVAVCVK